MNTIKVGLLGLGTVGSGTLDVLRRNHDEIARRAGCDIQIIAAAVRDPKKIRDVDTKNVLVTDDLHAVIEHPDVDILVELIGGENTSRKAVLEAIGQGKHIVTANKALIALHGNEIFTAAHKRGVTVAFEAAVAGGIPIIKAIREGLAANRIQGIAGIINGTSNYILTHMRDEGRPFDEVLADAQQLGYAEADPSFDVGGIDAAHKLTILASIAFGIPLQFEKVFIEGIADIQLEDIEYAKHFGYQIKHIGFANRVNGGVELRVHPTLVPERAILANVDGVMNAIQVFGDAVGSTVYYGAGAGSEPTASAVIADIVEVARTLAVNPEHRVPYLAFQPHALEEMPVLSPGDIETSYYLRLTALDKPGVLADITRLLGDAGISIEAILQKEPTEGAEYVSIIMLTHKTKEKHMSRAISAIEPLDTVQGSVTKIRLELL